MSIAHPENEDISTATLEDISRAARACRVCAADLPLGPRPVFQVDRAARILIAAQAPGTKFHASGRPFTDASGDRLRSWMGIEAETFYDPSQIAIVPMGFCYPGRGKSGDLPPRPECAALWRGQLLQRLPDIALTLVIGQYAQGWHLKGRRRSSLTETVRHWRDYGVAMMPLPHPSPRNNGWLKANPWFAAELLPVLAERVGSVLL